MYLLHEQYTYNKWKLLTQLRTHGNVAGSEKFAFPKYFVMKVCFPYRQALWTSNLNVWSSHACKPMCFANMLAVVWHRTKSAGKTNYHRTKLRTLIPRTVVEIRKCDRQLLCKSNNAVCKAAQSTARNLKDYLNFKYCVQRLSTGIIVVVHFQKGPGDTQTRIGAHPKMMQICGSYPLFRGATNKEHFGIFTSVGTSELKARERTTVAMFLTLSRVLGVY